MAHRTDSTCCLLGASPVHRLRDDLTRSDRMGSGAPRTRYRPSLSERRRCRTSCPMSDCRQRENRGPLLGRPGPRPGHALARRTPPSSRADKPLMTTHPISPSAITRSERPTTPGYPGDSEQIDRGFRSVRHGSDRTGDGDRCVVPRRARRTSPPEARIADSSARGSKRFDRRCRDCARRAGDQVLTGRGSLAQQGPPILTRRHQPQRVRCQARTTWPTDPATSSRSQAANSCVT